MNTPAASAAGVAHIGVDVCAQWLGIHSLPRKKITRLANTPAGHTKRIAPPCEPRHPGGHLRLRAGAMAIAAAHARNFARTSIKLVKTEAIDAAVFSAFCAVLRPKADILPAF